MLTTSKIRDNVEEKVDHRNYRAENNLPRTQKEENFIGNGGEAHIEDKKLKGIRQLFLC